MAVLRAHHKLSLKRELAVGALTQYQLADKYGVTQPAISQFAAKYADDIQHIRENLEDEFAGIALAHKKNRLAHLGDQVELIDGLLDSDPAANDRAALLRAKQAALKDMANELGQLVVKIDTSSKLEVKVNGVNLEDLK